MKPSIEDTRTIVSALVPVLGRGNVYDRIIIAVGEVMNKAREEERAANAAVAEEMGQSEVAAAIRSRLDQS